MWIACIICFLAGLAVGGFGAFWFFVQGLSANIERNLTPQEKTTFLALIQKLDKR